MGDDILPVVDKKKIEDLEKNISECHNSEKDYLKFSQELAQIKLGGCIKKAVEEIFIRMLEKCLSYKTSCRPTFKEINKKYFAAINEIMKKEELAKEEEKVISKSNLRNK